MKQRHKTACLRKIVVCPQFSTNLKETESIETDTIDFGRIYEQIDKYKHQEISKITVGNLKNKRDYLAIKDTVKYYQAIMARGLSGEIYNVGSGKSIRIYDLLVRLVDEAGLTHDVIEEQIYANKQIEVADIYADMSKIKAIESFCQNTALHSDAVK